MNIKTFTEFTESISGTELVVPIGPNYGEEDKKKITNINKDAIYSDLTGFIYMRFDYDDLYNQYLKIGGTPLIGFNKENLDLVIYNLENNN